MLLFGDGRLVDETLKFLGDFLVVVLAPPPENLKSLKESIQLTDKLGSTTLDGLKVVFTASSS